MGLNNTIKKESSSETGIALIALIAVMMVLGVVAYTFISILTTQRYVEVAQHNAMKSFYLAEGAIPIGKKYYFNWYSQSQTQAPPAWAEATTGFFLLFDDKALGDGTFDLWIDWGTGPEAGYAWYLSYGTVGSAESGP